MASVLLMGFRLHLNGPLCLEAETAAEFRPPALGLGYCFGSALYIVLTVVRLRVTSVCGFCAFQVYELWSSSLVKKGERNLILETSDLARCRSASQSLSLYLLPLSISLSLYHSLSLSLYHSLSLSLYLSLSLSLSNSLSLSLSIYK